eukprot:14040754-Ditylum_brightwellii.AAC.1
MGHCGVCLNDGWGLIEMGRYSGCGDYQLLKGVDNLFLMGTVKALKFLLWVSLACKDDVVRSHLHGVIFKDIAERERAGNGFIV